MTQAPQSSSNQYGTLGEVNSRLKMLGFSAIGSEKAQIILNQIPRHRLISALQKAHVDQGARRFLETLIPIASNDPEPVPTSNQQPAQRPAPQQSEARPSPSQSAPNSNQQGQGQNNQPQPQADYSPPNQVKSLPQNSGRAPDNRSADPENSSQSARQSQGDEREFISHHVYGGKAALCWDVDKTKSGDYTLRLEAAKAIGERKYDWNNKITIQLTRDELPCVAAVFLGILPKTEGKNHGVGDQQGKGFEIEHQGNKLFVKVFAPQKPPCAVPVSPEDAFTVASLLVRQIRKGKPWLSGNDIITMLRAIIGRMKSETGNQ